MIPHRTPGNEIFGNELKGRVTACRRRIRVSRVAKRTQVNNDADELFAEKTPSVSGIPDYDPCSLLARPVLPAPVVSLNYQFRGVEAVKSETLQLVGEQEVGIP